MSDAIREPRGTERISASLINALHRSRRDRAIRFLADHAHLLADAEEPAPPKMPQAGRKPDHAGAAARTASLQMPSEYFVKAKIRFT